MIKVGQGFDIHHLENGIPLMLGGLKLEAEKGSKGHSDGDVLLHALIDALLGATGLGDIGDWFSPDKAVYKGIASTELLKPILETLQKEHVSIINVDATILLETPKLGVHKQAIKDNIAALLTLDHHCVSVKAKTMEGLGAIGTGNAIAAMVNVLIEKLG